MIKRKMTWGEHLYLFSAGEICKVGRSKDVARRHLEVSRGMPWAEVRIIATFHGAGFCEPWVHSALASYERKGEWFKCTEKQALTGITQALPG